MALQSIMARDGALADLLALFLRDDISAWGARRMQRGGAMRAPLLKQLVDANIEACVQRMSQVRPREPPEVCSQPRRTILCPYLSICKFLPRLGASHWVSLGAKIIDVVSACLQEGALLHLCCVCRSIPDCM